MDNDRIRRVRGAVVLTSGLGLIFAIVGLIVSGTDTGLGWFGLALIITLIGVTVVGAAAYEALERGDRQQR